MRRTSWNMAIFSPARPRSPEKVAALKREALAELAKIEEMGGAAAAVEIGYMKSRLVEVQHRASRGDRGGRAGRRRRQPIHRGRALAADRRRQSDHGRARTCRGGADRASERLARTARREGRAGRSRRTRARRDGRPQHGRAFDRRRQGGRHHRRMGQCFARGVRGIPRADGRLLDRPAGRRRARRRARRGRARLHQNRQTRQIPRRQAGSRRPFQRRRTNRRARPRRRFRRDLRRHPLDPGRTRRDREEGGRPLHRPVDPLRLACHAGP